MIRQPPRSKRTDTPVPYTTLVRSREAVPDPEILLASLVETLGRVHITAVDATALALGLTGDTISANLIVVGMAVQLGLLPLKPDSIEQAIKLNGVATKLNIRAFRLGRLFIVDPEHVSKLARRAGGPAAVPRTLAEVIAHRSDRKSTRLN